MQATVSVTFEYDRRPPVTWRGTVEAGGVQTLAARAVRDAKRALRPVNWQSIVIVILDRHADARDEDEESSELHADAS
jgi:arginase family enzyme